MLKNLTKKYKIQKKLLKNLQTYTFTNTPQKFSTIPSISPPTLKTLEKNNFINLLPIQASTYEGLYTGKNLLARDRTGSGKTLAFSLPLIENLRKQGKFTKMNNGYLLIMTPTRELALQITDVIENLKNFENEYNVVACYGGTNVGENIKDLSFNPHIIVGTPGRVKDLIDRKFFKTEMLEKIVLDETDRMLDMGFLNDMEYIFKQIKISKDKNGIKDFDDMQYALFSATTPKWVLKIAKGLMKKDLIQIDLLKNATLSIPKEVKHYYAVFDNQEDKLENVNKLIYSLTNKNSQVIIFTNTKIEADKIQRKRDMRLFSNCFHGGIAQDRREMILKGYRIGYFKVLICTDVAGRGLDIPATDLIVNLSPPQDKDDFIHRCGRTGRAGRSGSTLTLCTQQELRQYNNYVRETGIETNEYQDDGLIYEKFQENVEKLEKGISTKDFEKNEFLEQAKNNLLESYNKDELIDRLIYHNINLSLRGKLKESLEKIESYENEKSESDRSEEEIEGEKKQVTHFGNYLDRDEKIFIDLKNNQSETTLICFCRSNINQETFEKALQNFNIPYESIYMLRNNAVKIIFDDKYKCQQSYFKLGQFNINRTPVQVSYSTQKYNNKNNNNRDKNW